MKNQKSLLEMLMEYGDSDFYPFHMPGHKRSEGGFGFPDPFSIDITEIHGFDNLHHPEGILRESMDWAASVYGSDRTFYLVNGSTCGILSAVCGCVRSGGALLMGRNCHKSAYNGVFLNHLRAEYIYPQIMPEFGLQCGLLPKDIERMLIRSPEIEAVLIVSPTYEGIVSDIKEIARVVHRFGIPLIVDEAHGAHFPFGEFWPVSALDLGADVVVQSLHKTMPSLTQTALLHWKKGYVDIGGIERHLQIFQSSSPSYVLMAGIENSIRLMEDKGRERMREFAGRLETLRSSLRNMSKLSLVDESMIGSYGVWDLDKSKVVVSTRGTDLDGNALVRMLRDEYHLEMEMCGPDYVIGITTAWDSEEGLKRLENAFLEIDEKISSMGFDGKTAESDRIWASGGMSGQNTALGIGNVQRQVELDPGGSESLGRVEIPKARMTIYEAVSGKKKSVRLEKSTGLVSGEYVYLYPPGIPVIVPGEVIGKDMVDRIISYKNMGLPVQGPEDGEISVIQVVG